MLGNPTIFSQIEPTTRRGFNATLQLIQGETAKLQANQDLAKKLAAEAAKMQQEFRNDVALEKQKAQIDATKPVSQAALWQRAWTSEGELNRLFSQYAPVNAGFGAVKVLPDVNRPGLFTYYQERGGAFTQIEESELRQLATTFKDTGEAANRLTQAMQAGAPQSPFTQGGVQYLGAGEMENIRRKLVSPDIAIRQEGWAEYTLAQGRIPSTEVLEGTAKGGVNQTDQNAINETTRLWATLPNTWTMGRGIIDVPMGTIPALPANFQQTESVGSILINLRNRLEQYRVQAPQQNIEKLSGEAAIGYQRTKQMHDELNELVNNYFKVPGAIREPIDNLYLNPNYSDINATPANALIRKDMVGVNTARPETPGGGNYSATATWTAVQTIS